MRLRCIFVDAFRAADRRKGNGARIDDGIGHERDGNGCAARKDLRRRSFPEDGRVADRRRKIDDVVLRADGKFSARIPEGDRDRCAVLHLHGQRIAALRLGPVLAERNGREEGDVVELGRIDRVHAAVRPDLAPREGIALLFAALGIDEGRQQRAARVVPDGLAADLHAVRNIGHVPGNGREVPVAAVEIGAIEQRGDILRLIRISLLPDVHRVAEEEVGLHRQETHERSADREFPQHVVRPVVRLRTERDGDIAEHAVREPAVDREVPICARLTGSVAVLLQILGQYGAVVVDRRLRLVRARFDLRGDRIGEIEQEAELPQRVRKEDRKRHDAVGDDGRIIVLEGKDIPTVVLRALKIDHAVARGHFQHRSAVGHENDRGDLDHCVQHDVAVRIEGDGQPVDLHIEIEDQCRKRRLAADIETFVERVAVLCFVRRRKRDGLQQIVHARKGVVRVIGKYERGERRAVLRDGRGCAVIRQRQRRVIEGKTDARYIPFAVEIAEGDRRQQAPALKVRLFQRNGERLFPLAAEDEIGIEGNGKDRLAVRAVRHPERRKIFGNVDAKPLLYAVHDAADGVGNAAEHLLDHPVQPEGRAKHFADGGKLSLLLFRQPGIGEVLVEQRKQRRGGLLGNARAREQLREQPVLLSEQGEPAGEDGQNVARRYGEAQRVALPFPGKELGEADIKFKFAVPVAVEHPECKVEIGAALAHFVELQCKIEVCFGMDGDGLFVGIDDDGETCLRPARMVDRAAVDGELRTAVRRVDSDAVAEGNGDVGRGERTRRRADKIEQLAEIAHGEIAACILRCSARRGQGDLPRKTDAARFALGKERRAAPAETDVQHDRADAELRDAALALRSRAEHERGKIEGGEIEDAEQVGYRSARTQPVCKFFEFGGQEGPRRRRAVDKIGNAGVDLGKGFGKGGKFLIDKFHAQRAERRADARFCHVDRDGNDGTRRRDGELGVQRKTVLPREPALFDGDRDRRPVVNEVDGAGKPERARPDRLGEKSNEGRHVGIFRKIVTQGKAQAGTDAHARPHRIHADAALFGRKDDVARRKVDAEQLQKARSRKDGALLAQSDQFGEVGSQKLLEDLLRFRARRAAEHVRKKGRRLGDGETDAHFIQFEIGDAVQKIVREPLDERARRNGGIARDIAALKIDKDIGVETERVALLPVGDLRIQIVRPGKGEQRVEPGGEIGIVRVVPFIRGKGLCGRERHACAERLGDDAVLRPPDGKFTQGNVQPEEGEERIAVQRDAVLREAHRLRQIERKETRKQVLCIAAARGKQFRKEVGERRARHPALDAVDGDIDAAFGQIGKRDGFFRARIREAHFARDGERGDVEQQFAADDDFLRLIGDFGAQRLRREQLRQRGQPGNDVRIVRVIVLVERKGLRGRKRHARPERLHADARRRFGKGDVPHVEGDAERGQQPARRQRHALFGGGDHGSEVDGEELCKQRVRVDGEFGQRKGVADEFFYYVCRALHVGAHVDAVQREIDDGDALAAVGKRERLFRAAVSERKFAPDGEGRKIERHLPSHRDRAVGRGKIVGERRAHRLARDDVRELYDHARHVQIGGGIARLGDGLLRIGERSAHVDARERELRADFAERDRPVPVNVEREADGDLHPCEREDGRERRAAPVCGDRKIAAAQLRKEIVRIEPLSRPRRGERREQGGELRGLQSAAETVAEAEIDVAFIGEEQLPDLRAQCKRRHIGGIDKDEPFRRLPVESEPQAEGDGPLQNGRERRRKTARGGHRLLLRARSGLGGVFGEIVLIDGAVRPVRPVFIDGMIHGAAADGDAHRRRVAFVDVRGEHLPRPVEGIRYGDALKGGQPREPARRHHLVDVIGGRLVRGGVEIIGLRVRPVLVDDDGIGGEQRLLVDDIDGELRPGEPARRLEVLDGHVPRGRARLPLRLQSVIGGSAARRVPPDDAVADIAELPRRIDHARTGDVRLHEDAVVVLLPGVDLLGEHRVDDARHLRIIGGLRAETRVHVADVFERAVHIGRGTVRRKRIRDGHEPLVHDVGLRLIEIERIDREHAADEHCAGSRCGKHFEETAAALCLEPDAPLAADGLRDVPRNVAHAVLRVLLLFFHIFLRSAAVQICNSML